MRTRVSISFWFRRINRSGSGCSPSDEATPTPPDEVGTIVCRIVVGGRERTALSTGIRTPYGSWHPQGAHIAGKSAAVRTANESLVKMRDRLTDIVADLDRQNKPVTPLRIKRLYLSNGATLSMIELFEAFLAEQRTLIGIEISKATAIVHRQRFGNLRAFLAAHKLTDLRPEEFTANMADKMLYWLMKEKQHKRNTALKNLQNVSQVLTWGVRREHVDKNPMALYQYRLAQPGEIKYLTVGEIGILRAAHLPDYLARVRDCFLFQCWTGLAYADLKALDAVAATEYRTDATGTLWRLLRVRRQKSTLHHGYECTIPLLPEAKRLLNQYNDVLPVPSNVAFNRYLKQIGVACGITADKMTTHVGRKTAGVMMLNLGIRMEVVSKFLGHSSVKMTERLYAKILDTTLVNEFERVFGGPVAAAYAPLHAPEETPVQVVGPAPRRLLLASPPRAARRVELPVSPMQGFEMLVPW